MRAAIYARVSTADKGQDPTMQTREMGEFCQRRGWEIYKEYVDTGVSGMKEHRPALDRMLADAKQRRFDVIIVWKLDRFSRSLRHLINSLADLEALGVAFVSLKDNLDLSTPSGRLMFQIIGAMAEFERNLIRERVISGIANAKAKGKHCGRPVTVQTTPAEVRGFRVEGLSFRAIGTRLGISARTAARLATDACTDEAKPLQSKAS